MYHIHVKQALKILIDEVRLTKVRKLDDDPVTWKSILGVCSAIEKRIEDNG